MKCNFQLDGTGGETCQHCGRSAEKPIDQECTASTPAKVSPKKAVRLKGRAAVKAWRAARGEDTAKSPCGGCGKSKSGVTSEQAKSMRDRMKKIRQKKSRQ